MLLAFGPFRNLDRFASDILGTGRTSICPASMWRR